MRVIDVITNKGMRYEVGDEFQIDGIWYKLMEVKKAGWELDDEPMYNYIVKPLFVKTLEDLEKYKKLMEESKARVVTPGQRYRHFKNKDYVVVAIANHTEKTEKLVVYKGLYEPYETHARPYDMFVSPVDRYKYPNVKQTFRMELIENGDEK